MKKLLGILVLGLLWCNTSFSNDLNLDKLQVRVQPEIILKCLVYDEDDKEWIDMGFKIGFNYITVPNENEKILVTHSYNHRGSFFNPAEAIVHIDKNTGNWYWWSTFVVGTNLSFPDFSIHSNVVDISEYKNSGEATLRVTRNARAFKDISFKQEISRLYTGANFTNDSEDYVNYLQTMNSKIYNREKPLLEKKIKVRTKHYACVGLDK